MKDPLVIFVAAPYGNPSAPHREANVNRVHHVTKELMLKGHIVLECHSLEQALYDDGKVKKAHFLRQTLNWLEKCDAIYCVAPSPGANLELEKAQELGLQVFRNLDRVPTYTQLDVELNEIDDALVQQSRDSRSDTPSGH